ncbi:hypothetical protein SB18R_03370 [Pseudomonas oryzihabitans]|nr:hypothetical protein SB9_12605 [Pseudomonas psychrotolerans]KTT78281.1 hypothetical protein SB18R_03370 [Pseudomonas psychrotolerans]
MELLLFLAAVLPLKKCYPDSMKPRENGASKMAEAQRFELWDPCESAVFKSAAEYRRSKGFRDFSFP